MRDFITIGKVRDQLIEKISKVQQDIKNLQQAQVSIGIFKEKSRILQILTSMINESETDTQELRLKIILDLMDKITND